MSEQQFLEAIRGCEGIIVKLTGAYAFSEDDKKDLYQEILLNAWRGFGSYKGDAKFSTWLYRVALNTIFTLNRRKKETADLSMLEERFCQEAHAGVSGENARELYRAIRRLSEVDRAVILLYIDGYSVSEIAEVMGVKPTNLSVKLFRIKEQLKNMVN